MNTATGVIIVLIGLMGFFFLLSLLDAMKLRRLRKKYNEKDNKSKAGEQRRQLKERESGTKRLDKSKRRELQMATSTSSPRKDSSSTRGFFRRTRRRK